MPVRQSFVAEVVPRDDLLQAIALNSASFNLARVVGPAIAGVTLALYGSAFNFGANTLTYTAVLLGLLLIDGSTLIKVPQPAARPSIRVSLVEGIRYAVDNRYVAWLLVLLGGMSIFAMNFQVLLPLFSRITLELGAVGLGALFAALGIGSLLGSLVLAYMGERRPAAAADPGRRGGIPPVRVHARPDPGSGARVPGDRPGRPLVDAHGEHDQRHDPAHASPTSCADG